MMKSVCAAKRAPNNSSNSYKTDGNKRLFKRTRRPLIAALLFSSPFPSFPCLRVRPSCLILDALLIEALFLVWTTSNEQGRKMLSTTLPLFSRWFHYDGVFFFHFLSGTVSPLPHARFLPLSIHSSTNGRRKGRTEQPLPPPTP